jgi:MFS family permease
MSLPAALLSIPLGRLIDTRDRTRLLLVLATLTMAGSIATGLAAGFGDLLAWRALAGLGMMEEAVVLSLVADLFPPHQRGRANIAIILGEYGGSALGFALAGWLLPVASLLPWLPSAGNWRVVPLLFGVAGLLLALPLLRLREPVRHERDAGAGDAAFRASLVALARHGRLLWPLLAAQVAMATMSNLAATWSAPMLSRGFAMSPAETGKALALALTIPPLIGAAAAGLLIDRLRIRGGAITVAVIATAAALPAACFPLAPSAPLAVLLLSLLMAAHTAAALASTTIGILAIPNELRGLWFGVGATFALIAGFTIAPTLVAWIGVGMGADGLARSLAIVLAAAALTACISYVLAWRGLVRPAGHG